MKVELRREVARIDNVSLGFEEHGVFTAMLFMNYGNTRQTIGCHNLVSIAGAYLSAMLRACGVSLWEELKGRTIYVLFALDDIGGNNPLGIESLPMDGGKQMIFSDFLEA